MGDAHVPDAQPSVDDLPLGMVVRAAALGSTAAATVWVAMSLTYPFGWDQGLFAWVGDVIVRGGMPYRDAWDLKGPVVYYVYALAQMLLGVHLWSIRVVDLLFLTAATIAVFRAALTLTDRTAARCAALTFFLWYASQSYWHTAQPDAWVGMILIVALGPIMVEGRVPGRWRAASIGCCIGLATLSKPLYAVFLLLPLAYVSLNVAPRRAVFAVIFAGWLLPISIAAGWFAWRGALGDLIDVHLRYAMLYAGLSPGNRARALADYFLSTRVVGVALPVVLYGGFVLWRQRRVTAILLIGWSVIVVALVTAQNRFFAYHWLPILPAATLLGAVGLHALRARSTALACVTWTVILVHCLAPILLEEARFISWLTGRIDRAAYYDGYGQPGDDMKAVEWLRHQGQPGDVFVFGWNGDIAWLSARRIVSRFGFSMPLLMGPEPEVRSAYRKELLSVLAAAPPRYIIVGTQSAQIIGTVMTLDDFPELADLVLTSYREKARFGSVSIHEVNISSTESP